jgi:hypothetical protein
MNTMRTLAWPAVALGRLTAVDPARAPNGHARD